MKQRTTFRTWKLKVDERAEQFLSSALDAFAAANKRQLVCDGMDVQFIGAGEAGEAGAAEADEEDEEDRTSRMWATLMRQLCDPTHGLFERCVPADAASSLVPCAREDPARHRHVGRVILRALLDSKRLPKDFVAGAADREGGQQPCSFMLSYVLAPNDLEEADRLSIGTCGNPREGRAAAEAHAVLRTLGSNSPALARALRGALDGGGALGALGNGGGGALDSLDSLDWADREAAAVCGHLAEREARANAICAYLHEQLIGVRRAALEALKEGFTAKLDVRAALRLFEPHELVTQFCAEHGAED